MSTPTKAPVPARAGASNANSLKMEFVTGATKKKAPNNMNEPLKDMSFKVPESFHRRYKAAAAINGLQMKDILEQSFDMWCEANGLNK